MNPSRRDAHKLNSEPLSTHDKPTNHESTNSDPAQTKTPDSGTTGPTAGKTGPTAGKTGTTAATTGPVPGLGPDAESRARPGSLLVIFLVVMIDLLGFGLVLPLLPLYAKQYSVDPDSLQSGIMIGLLMASFSAMQFFFSPVWGMVSDRVGRRPVLLLGLLGSTVCYAIFGLATVWQSLFWIFVSRIGAGICGATISTAQAYIADTTTTQGRSRGMALVGMAFGVGFTFGPVLGFFAVPEGTGDPGPWPGYLASILSAIAFCLAVVLLPESLNAKSKSAAGRFDLQSIRASLALPGVPTILLLIFILVFSFANFETTLSMLIKAPPFELGWREICATFAFIGFTLALIQGGVVRPLYKRVSERSMATAGAIMEIAGFVLVTIAISQGSLAMLFASLIVVVTGFSFMQPSINSLLSRHAPEDQQGTVLGTGQSVNALARILGSAVAIPFLTLNVLSPYILAACLLSVGAILLRFVLTGLPETLAKPE